MCKRGSENNHLWFEEGSKSSSYCVRLKAKFEIDHPWEWKGYDICFIRVFYKAAEVALVGATAEAVEGTGEGNQIEDAEGEDGEGEGGESKDKKKKKKKKKGEKEEKKVKKPNKALVKQMQEQLEKLKLEEERRKKEEEEKIRALEEAENRRLEKVWWSVLHVVERHVWVGGGGDMGCWNLTAHLPHTYRSLTTHLLYQPHTELTTQ